MIICIVENSYHWDKFGIPYLIDTKLITNSYLKGYLEAIEGVVEIPYDDKLSEDYAFDIEYIIDLQIAMVEVPQYIDKVISIIFT